VTDGRTLSVKRYSVGAWERVIGEIWFSFGETFRHRGLMQQSFLAVFLLAITLPITAAELSATNAPRFRAVISPEVQRDRSVIFRLQARNATNVIVSGEWSTNSTSLNLDTNGVWSGTAGPLNPGIYGYSFTVDGLQMLDPANPALKPMRSPRTSILEIPGETLLPYDFDPAIAHGTVRQHTYFSKSLDRTRSLHVYTPPQYDQKRFSKFPVLYLLHGAGDNDATWSEFGRAHFILDNLLAHKKARPMVIVMTDGHALLQTGGFGTNAFLKSVAAFERDLLKEVLPFVERNYRVRRDRGSRAIAGLSMGGGQSLLVGLNHLELFAWVGAFSSFAPDPEQTLASALANGTKTNKRLKLLWIACGKDDFLVDRNKSLDETLTRHGVTHVFKITEGKHQWPVWRAYLGEVLPQLF